MCTTTKSIRVRIVKYNDPESPREWDNVGTMVCWHSRYNLGDRQPTIDSADFLRDLAADHVGAYDPELISDHHLGRILDKHFLILPLYLFDHSGLSISTGGFSCPWDSGQVGYIYCEKSHGIAECGDEETALKRLESEVSIYDDYLSGNVYGFVIEECETCETCEHEEWEHVDSCFGFYGSDPDKNGMLEHVDPVFHSALRAAEISY